MCEFSHSWCEWLSDLFSTTYWDLHSRGVSFITGVMFWVGPVAFTQGV